MKPLRLSVITLLLFIGPSCVTNNKEFNKIDEIKIEEFDAKVKIEEIEEVPIKESQEKEKSLVKVKSKDAKNKAVKKESVKNNIKPKDPVPEEPVAKKETAVDKVSEKVKRKPELEDSEGFSGRRPIVEPYRVGEEVVLGLSYFGVEAGKFTMQVRPMVQVNGNKSYHFRYIIKSSPLFSMFYSVDDIAETFVDYETLVPYSYEIHVDETKQKRETRTFFDHKNKKAILWDKKVKKNEPTENTKIEWELLEYPQNVFSAAYYLRNFTLAVGKKLKINVGHEGKNILMTADVVRKEKLYTALGAFDTFVLKPSFDVDGKFKPTGENYLWLTADDKKIIVRIESKIKIGSIIGEVQKISK